jgi:hypothetical protein
VKDAMLFLIRSVTKIGGALTDETVTMWPYSAMARGIWGLAAFPDNEWPASYVGMSVCVTLNMGVYILALVIMTLAVLNYDIVIDVMLLHIIFARDLKYQVYDKRRVLRQ